MAAAAWMSCHVIGTLMIGGLACQTETELKADVNSIHLTNPHPDRQDHVATGHPQQWGREKRHAPSKHSREATQALLLVESICGIHNLLRCHIHLLLQETTNGYNGSSPHVDTSMKQALCKMQHACTDHP